MAATTTTATTRGVVCVRGAIESGAAERVLTTALPGFSASAERKLYYPYYSYVLRYATRTLIGQSHVRVLCLIDARKNIGATADGFEITPLSVDAEDVLEPRIERGDAERTARRYSAYVLRQRHKALVRPEVAVESCSVVHKPFWLLLLRRTGSSDPAPIRVIVDGVTGSFHWV